MINSYKDLIVWQKSVDLCVRVYRETEKYPKSELFGLSLQSRKCAVSIPSNIAEGQRRRHKAEYLQFLGIAFGSGGELETQLLIASKIGYLTRDKYIELSNLLDEIMRMLNKLMQKLE